MIIIRTSSEELCDESKIFDSRHEVTWTNFEHKDHPNQFYEIKINV